MADACEGEDILNSYVKDRYFLRPCSEDLLNITQVSATTHKKNSTSLPHQHVERKEKDIRSIPPRLVGNSKVSTGGRISELLSLQIADVYQNRRAVTDLLFDKSIVKGGEISRAVPVNADGRLAIETLIAWHREKYGKLDVKRPLFPSRNKSGTVAMNRQTAHEMLKIAFTAAGLNGKLATHSLRKSFAQRVYEQSGDIYLVQELLGHRSVSTTQKYLGVNYATAREFVEAIAIGYQRDESPLLSGSLKKTSDDKLLLELAKRGYDISGVLREDTETAEIVKIS